MFLTVPRAGSPSAPLSSAGQSVELGRDGPDDRRRDHEGRPPASESGRLGVVQLQLGDLGLHVGLQRRELGVRRVELRLRDHGHAARQGPGGHQLLLEVVDLLGLRAGVVHVVVVVPGLLELRDHDGGAGAVDSDAGGVSRAHDADDGLLLTRAGAAEQIDETLLVVRQSRGAAASDGRRDRRGGAVAQRGEDLVELVAGRDVTDLADDSHHRVEDLDGRGAVVDLGHLGGLDLDAVQDSLDGLDLVVIDAGGLVEAKRVEQGVGHGVPPEGRVWWTELLLVIIQLFSTQCLSRGDTVYAIYKSRHRLHTPYTVSIH